MSFTVKAKVSTVERQADGQSMVVFSANYVDADGNRVNEDWAKATPGFTNTMYVLDDVVTRDGLEPGQAFTLTYAKDED